MKKTLLYLAALVGFVACSQDLTEDVVRPAVEADDVVLTISASMDETQTRIVSEDGLNFKFEKGDKLGVFFYNDNFTNSLLGNVPFVAGEPDDEGKVDFSLVDTDYNIGKFLKQNGTQIFAYAPFADVEASLDGGIENGGVEAASVTRTEDGFTLTRNFNIPTEQANATDAKGVAQYYTVVAKPVSPVANADGNFNAGLSFSGIFSLIKFSILNESGVEQKVTGVKFTVAENEALTGTFKADLTVSPKFAEDEGYALTPVEGKTNNYIEMTLDEPITMAVDQEIMLYGVVNSGTYAAGAKMEVMTTSGGRNYIFSVNTMNEKVITRQQRAAVGLKLKEGEGVLQSSENIEVIKTVDELKALAEAVNSGDTKSGKTVVLTADLDLDNAKWTPIGTETNPFSGTFEGGNHKISNLKVNTPDTGYAGLFGRVASGAVKDLNIENAAVNGYNNVGVLAGSAYTGSVANCRVSGTIKVDGKYHVGGISGYGYATIHNCSVEGDDESYVKGTYDKANFEGDAVGGIVGYSAEQNDADGEVIKGCTATINVEGSRKVGGIVGQAGCNSNVSDCTYTGNVKTNASAEYIADNSSKIFVGGIVGEVAGGSPLTVTIKGNTVASGSTVTGYLSTTTAAVCPGSRSAATITMENNTAEGVIVTCNLGDGLIYDGEKYIASTNEGLALALSKNITDVHLAASDKVYTINTSNSNADLKITGPSTVARSAGVAKVQYSGGDLRWKSVTIKDVTLDTQNNGEMPNGGLISVDEALTFDNCVIENVYFCLSSNVVFNSCTFNIANASYYNLWTYGANVECNNCVFNSLGLCVLVYAHGGGADKWAVNKFNECEFNTTNPVDGKAAIEIDSSLCSFDVYVYNCTETGFPAGNNSGNPLYNLRSGTFGENCKLTLDGKEVIADGVMRDVESGEYELTGVKGMQWFANEVNVNKNSFSGETVILTENVDLDGIDWEPIGQTGNATFSGVFDGKEKTISNLNTKYVVGSADDYLYSNGLFGWVEGHSTQPITIKNVTISGATIDAVHYIGAVAGHVSGSVLIENCKVSDANIKANFVNLGSEWDYADKTGGVVGYIESDGATISNCSVTNATIQGYRDLGGIVGYANANTTVKDCNVLGNTTISVVFTDETNYKASEYTTPEKYHANTIIGEQSATCNSTNNTCAESVKVSVPIANGISYLADANGSSYGVSNAEGLLWLATEINKQDTSRPFRGKTFLLTDDIDLAGKTWTPINAFPHEGLLSGATFDGQGYKIKNMTYSQTTNGALGFISYNVGELTFKDLTFENAEIDGRQGVNKTYVGVIIGQTYSNVNFENVHVTNSNVLCCWQAGGFVGWGGETKSTVVSFNDCSISDTFVGGFNCTAGAFFGMQNTTVTCENCKATDNVQLYTDYTPTAKEQHFVGHTGFVTLQLVGDTNDGSGISVVSTYPAAYLAE